MYCISGVGFRTGLGQAVQALTQLDVVSPKIDVFAQKALFRMLNADSESNRMARNMIYAVKLKVLAGIYKEDQKAPALRAQVLGKGWWQMIPKGMGAICLKEPVGRLPMIVFRDKIRSAPSLLDPALKQAWIDCGIAELSPPPYRPKAFPQPPGPKKPPSGLTERELIERESGKWHSSCHRYVDDWLNYRKQQCGTDKKCMQHAFTNYVRLKGECDSVRRRCMKGHSQILPPPFDPGFTTR